MLYTIKCNDSLTMSRLLTYSLGIELMRMIRLTRIDSFVRNIRSFFAKVWSMMDNLILWLVFVNVYGIVNDVLIVLAFDLIAILGNSLVKFYVTFLKQKYSIDKRLVLSKWSLFFKVWSFLSMI